MKIPSNNKWTQLNNGDLFGVLKETHNVNFDKAGVAKLADKAVVFSNNVVADGGDADFEQVHGIETFGGDIYAVTDGHAFKGDIDGTFLSDSASDNLGRTTSSVVCYGLLYAVDGTTIDTYTGAGWTSGVITGLNAGGAANVNHPLCVFDSLPTYKLAVGDVNTVKVYNSSNSNSGATNLSLPENYIITSLAYRSGYLYVGTKTEDGQEAKVFVWDGNSANANFSIPMGASFVFSLAPYKGTVVGVTNEGELFIISGTQKVTLAGFPIFYTENKRWTSSADEIGNVLHKGISVVGDNIYISVEGTTADNTFVEGMKDGLWCFDPEIGLYHYAAPTTNPTVSDTSWSLSNNEITTTADHKLVTGDPVTFFTLSGVSGVNNDQIYYAVVTGTNTLKLAGNRYDALQGNTVLITGTPTGSDRFVYSQNDSYGTVLGATAGAVMSTNHRTAFAAENLVGDLVFGAEPYSESDAAESTIQCFTNAYNKGWITTQKMYGKQIDEFWTNLTVYLNGNLHSSEKIVVKYRIEERASMPTRDVAITWVNATEFTTTDSAARNNLKVGDEVVFLRGCGQGQSSHIVSVDVSANTTTVKVEDSYGTASSTAMVYFTNFKKMDEISSTRHNNGYATFAINQQSPWIQFKIEMHGFDIEIVSLDLANRSKKVSR